MVACTLAFRVYFSPYLYLQVPFIIYDMHTDIFLLWFQALVSFLLGYILSCLSRVPAVHPRELMPDTPIPQLPELLLSSAEMIPSTESKASK